MCEGSPEIRTCPSGLDEAFALGAFTGQFPGAAHGFGALARFLLRRLFEVGARFHFPEEAFALHLFLQGAQGLFDIIVADNDLYDGQLSIWFQSLQTPDMSCVSMCVGDRSGAYITGQQL